jgi:hypothetical protein
MADEIVDLSEPGNKRMSRSLYDYILKSSNYAAHYGSMPLGKIYGKTVIPTSDAGDFLLFDHCEYCGRNEIELALFGQIICSSCGAPIC